MSNLKEKPSTSSKSPKQIKVVPVNSNVLNEPDVSLAEKGRAFQDYPSGIAWKNISKTVLSHVTKEPIKLLNNCCGVVNDGEIVALMGLSGCGKSTLLKVLSGRDQMFCTGDVYFGSHQVSLGQSQLTSEDIKRQIGYVAQDDVFFDTLTVKEHLTFSVQLRGNLESKEQERDAVQQLIVDLNLARCADNPIRVISGGERKRCSIATELLADPCVLVLDEATSGLDSAVSAALIHNLRILANGNNAPYHGEKATKSASKYREHGPRQKLAVIMSIHQPSTGLFYEFDKVMFLVEGRVAYYGSTGRVMSYLARAGYELPKVVDDHGNQETLAYNPADYMMELLFSVIPQVQSEDLGLDNTKKKKKTQCKNAKERWELVRQKFLREKNSKFVQVLKATAFKKSRFAPEYAGWWPRYILAEVYDSSQAEGEIARFVEAFHSVRGEAATQELSVRRRGHSFWHELLVLLHRSNKCSSRSSALSMLTVSEVLIVGTLAGLTWFQTKLEEESVSKFAGFLFFVCAYWFFAGVFTGLLDFLPERLVVAKDHAAGAYRLSTYFISRTLGGIPPRVVLPAVFAVVAGLLAMHPDIYTDSTGAGTFIAIIFLLMLTTLTGEALGVFLGIATNNLERSVTIANVTALTMTIVGGFYIKKLPVFMDWLKYLSVLKYCFDALCQVQFPPDTYISCDSGWYIGNCYGQREIDGTTVRAFLDVDRLTLGGNIGAMIAIYFGLKFAGYLALVYVSR